MFHVIFKHHCFYWNVFITSTPPSNNLSLACPIVCPGLFSVSRGNPWGHRLLAAWGISNSYLWLWVNIGLEPRRHLRVEAQALLLLFCMWRNLWSRNAKRLSQRKLKANSKAGGPSACACQGFPFQPMAIRLELPGVGLSIVLHTLQTSYTRGWGCIASR